MEPSAALSSFQAWLKAHDVHLHPALHFAHDDVCGTSLFTRDVLSSGTCAIDLPADLPITSTFSRDAIFQLVGIRDAAEREEQARTIEANTSLTASEWVVFHLAIVRFLFDETLLTLDDAGHARSDLGLALLVKHAAYIQAIPYPEVAPTPLHFNAAELQLLRGTSLHGATLERRRRGKVISRFLRSWLVENGKQSSSVLPKLAQADERTWTALWYWADTAFGSRSFPPRIVGFSDEAIGAVLIPGLDSFNHQRGRPVTWKYEPPTEGSGTSGRTQLILDSPTDAGAQVFNNYGAKSTEELLGSYGFVLEDPAARQDDALGLVVSAQPSAARAGAQVPTSGSPAKRHWWRHGPTAEPPAALIEDIRRHLLTAEPEGDETDPSQAELRQVEQDGEVHEVLHDMLAAKLSSFQAGPSLEPIPSDEGDSRESCCGAVREHVARMVQVYRDGQEAILKQALSWCDDKLEELESRWSELAAGSS